jgi:hypothetical protein
MARALQGAMSAAASSTVLNFMVASWGSRQTGARDPALLWDSEVITTARHRGRIEIRPDVGPALAARGADEARLDVGQPHVVGPAIGIHRHAVAASVVGAVDEHAMHAHLASHFAEGDFLGSHDR